jgi:nitroimidazol reductase NimA-like FMN-containing flavoprotein (pyridoxamine 5'-phosphate oxidase superfamily)
MRRKDKEIRDLAHIWDIIQDSEVCRLGLARDGMPYIVPVSFGYDAEALYFHTAREGKKITYIEANPIVCFEFERQVQLVSSADDPCHWTFSFQSVIGYGTVQELVAPVDKMYGLRRIVEHYAAGHPWKAGATALDGIRVWKVCIECLTGKQSKDQTGR